MSILFCNNFFFLVLILTFLKTMEKEQFKKWRKKNGFSQAEAANVLGLKRRMIQYYEKGKKGEKDIQIPKYIKLACEAIELKKKLKKLV